MTSCAKPLRCVSAKGLQRLKRLFSLPKALWMYASDHVNPKLLCSKPHGAPTPCEAAWPSHKHEGCAVHYGVRPHSLLLQLGKELHRPARLLASHMH